MNNRSKYRAFIFSMCLLLIVVGFFSMDAKAGDNKVHYSCSEPSIPQYKFDLYGSLETNKALITVTDEKGPSTEHATVRSFRVKNKTYHRFDFDQQKDGAYNLAMFIEVSSKKALIVDYSAVGIGEQGKPLLAMSCVTYL